MPESSRERAPALKIVRGDATAEEVAAVLAAISGQAEEAQAHAVHDDPDDTPGMWRARSRQMRQPVTPAPGAWRATRWG